MATERQRDDHGRFDISEPELEARRAEVIKLRVAGYGFRDIAKQLGIGLATAYNDFKAVMDRTKSEADSTADQERQVSLARIDKAIAVLMPMLDGENSLDAMDRLDKLEKRRAALLGLDAPAKVSAEVSTVGLDELAELRRSAEVNACSSSGQPKPPGDSGQNS